MHPHRSELKENGAAKKWERVCMCVWEGVFSKKELHKLGLVVASFAHSIQKGEACATGGWRVDCSCGRGVGGAKFLQG